MAYCTLCHRTFGKVSSLNQHLIDSPSHKHQSRDGDGANLSLSHERRVDPLHVDSEPAPNTGVPMLLSRLSLNAPTEYQGEDSIDVARVFAAAKRFRFRNPTPALIMHHTQTTLDVGIVRSIIEAAVRLVPAHDANGGSEARRQRDRQRAQIARQAEHDFLTNFSRAEFCFMTEDEQKERAVAHDQVLRATPDIRFATSTPVAGHHCLWIEYKHYFGFRENPFVAASERRQAQKYASHIGPGLVVYSLGFEQGHLCIDGVNCMKEIDVTQALEHRGAF